MAFTKLMLVRLASLALLAAALIPIPAAAQLAPAETPPAPALSAEQAQAIADVLNDDALRGALLGELERLAAGAPAGEGGPEGAAPAAASGAEPGDPMSFGRQIAETTQGIAESIAASAMQFGAQLARAPATLDAISRVSPEFVISAVGDLAILIVATVALFVFLRRMAKPFYRRMGAASEDGGLVRRGALIGGSVLVDAVLVVLAWAAGYLIALLVGGEMGTIGIRQTLYLNAFLTVEMLKVLVRGLLSPTARQLRLVRLPDGGAKRLARWLNVLISLLGYGQLLVVPIINQNVSFFAGRGVSTLISVFAILLMIGLVLRYRRPVAEWMIGHRDTEGGGMIRFFLRNWHIPVLVYLVGVLAIVLARPGGVLFPVLGASAEILLAIVVGVAAGGFLSRAMARGVALPPRVNERLPLLESRLNAFVPRILYLVRAAIVVIVVAFTLNTIGLVNVEAWLSSQIGARVSATVISVALILLAAFVAWLSLSSWVDYRLNPDYGGAPTAREQTLLTLLRNAATIVLAVITLMFVLSEIGIDIAPLIASAGVLGLAIGFGAQKLVQDIITGVFIQFENAMNVGDVVTVGGTTGVVERLTIRSVSLRDVEGAFHIIPFSTVDMVSNYMRDFAFFVADMGVAYREDVADAKQAMFDAFEELRANPEWTDKIMGDMQWFGLNSFGDSAIVLRARIKTQPGQQWAIGRAYNEIIKRIFDERGIEIPFPHQTIFFGEDKSGKAPAAHILVRPEGGAEPGPAQG